MKYKTGITTLTAITISILSAAVFPQIAQAETLRVGSSAENITSLDPARATATDDVAIVSWLFNGLVRFPPGSADPSKIEPDLALRLFGGSAVRFQSRRADFLVFRGTPTRAITHNAGIICELLPPPHPR